MKIRAFSKESLPYVGILALGVWLTACSGIPDWSDDPDAAATGAAQDDWSFPDLSQLPTPPGPPPSAAARGATVQTLEAARLQNQQAGENLDRQIENDFEFPASSSN